MNVDKYLEENIGIIDNDLTSFFIQCYQDQIDDDYLNVIIHMMKQVNIPTLDARMEALKSILTNMFLDYQYSLHLPLTEWIDNCLINHLGFSNEEILNFMIKHRNDLNDSVACIKLASDKKTWFVDFGTLYT
jgi:hypothetical protein